MTLIVPASWAGMTTNWSGTLHRILVGDAGPRRAVVVSVLALLVLASGAFVLGANVGLSLPWIVLALGIALVAGWWDAGLLPTAGSLWLVGMWWFAFPPLVGYLSGAWAVASRYSHPRMMGFAYTSARAELVGGLEYGLRFGLLFALVAGVLAYGAGAVGAHLVSRFE